MTDYLKLIIQPILVQPQALTITETTDEQGKLLSIRVSKNDMGRVIGKGGETIKSIRIIIHACGSLSKENVNIKVLEPII